MTLPLSGMMSTTMITDELGIGQSSPVCIGSAPFRCLAEKPSGIIKYSDFYGKTYIFVPKPNLYLWGRNILGQIGSGDTFNRSSPTSTIGGGTTWCQVSVADFHTAAVKTDGTLWTWGSSSRGALGTNSEVNRSSPGTTAGGGTTWCQASAGRRGSAAVKTDGTLWTWGDNPFGQLGDGTKVSRSSPGTTAGGGTTWCQVSSGGYRTAAIKTDGTLWTWGNNAWGALGNNCASERSSPGTTAGGGTTWCNVSVNYGTHAMGIKTDGTLWTWGSNFKGELGNNSVVNRSSPGTTAGGGSNWKQAVPSVQHSAAIKSDGTLWTWGYNYSGQLGDNSTVSRSSPGTTVGGGTTWCAVAAGGSGTSGATAGIKTNGTLWTWGNNLCGRLGSNTIAGRSSPGTTAGGGTTWCSVCASYGHMAALKSS